MTPAAQGLSNTHQDVTSDKHTRSMNLKPLN